MAAIQRRAVEIGAKKPFGLVVIAPLVDLPKDLLDDLGGECLAAEVLEDDPGDPGLVTPNELVKGAFESSNYTHLRNFTFTTLARVLSTFAGGNRARSL